MRFRLVAAAALATRGCAPDLDPTEHKAAYLIILGSCALAVLLLVVLRVLGGEEEKDGRRGGEDRPDRDVGP